MDSAGFLVFFPDGKPIRFENRQQDFVAESPEVEDLPFAHRFNFIAAMKVVLQTALVMGNDARVDFTQLQCVESIVEQHHFGIRAIALVPVPLFANQRIGDCGSVLVVDYQEDHHPD